jgi:hypothetical protein
VRPLILVVALIALSATPAFASLDIGPGQAGLSIGNSPVWDGIRLNFADHGIERIRGVNFTVWRANGDGPGEGSIEGLGLGLWGPKAESLRGAHFGIAEVVGSDEVVGFGASIVGVGAGTTSLFGGRDFGRGELRGIFLGGLGLGAGSDITGIGIGGLGMGAGGDISGVAVGGLGMGVGENLSGIAVGGLGMGIGENMSGLAIGGIGAGIGGHARGALVGGLGAGVGESFQGIGVGGIGLGIGGNADGLLLSGIGNGVGESFRGIAIAGIGMGVGKDFTGLGIGGIGLGAGERLTGIAIGGVGVGATETRALTAGLLMTRGEVMRGVTASAYNKWDFRMEGLSIGLLNITHELKGVQLGLLNIAYDNPGWRRILPLVNWGNN